MTHQEHSDETTRDATGTGEQAGKTGFSGLATHLAWALHLDEKQAEKVAEIAAQWSEGEGEYAFSRCESPAERLFLMGGMLGEHWEEGEECTLRASSDDGRESNGGLPEWISDSHVAVCWDCFVDSQVSIGKYRVDFLFILWMRVCGCSHDGQLGVEPRRFSRLAVEIDGHDFHSTKEQLAADHNRDVELLHLGIQTIRFTGSQVYSDPGGCFRKALEVAKMMDSDLTDQDNAVCDAHDEGIASATGGMVQ